MEGNPRKNDDCYFYYYSKCLKGDHCLFRHEENALGCEVVCQYWKEGKCLNERCNFRHMELKKNRKVIPCYWESRPGGCRKPHCPFRHLHSKDKSPDKKDGNVTTNVGMPGGVMNVPGNTAARNPSADGSASVHGPPVVRGDVSYAANPVDPIVVKFEEESDNESLTSSPNKSTSSPNYHSYTSLPRKKISSPLRVKTLEEIRLDNIQKETAAYYGLDCVYGEGDDNDDDGRKSNYEDDSFKVLTLEEIRERRKRKLNSVVCCNDNEYNQNLRYDREDEANMAIGLDSDDSNTINHRENVRVLTLYEIRKNREKKSSNGKRTAYNFDENRLLKDNEEISQNSTENCYKKMKLSVIPNSTSDNECFNDNELIKTLNSLSSRIEIEGCNITNELKSVNENQDESIPKKPIKLKRFFNNDNTTNDNIEQKKRRLIIMKSTNGTNVLVSNLNQSLTDSSNDLNDCKVVESVDDEKDVLSENQSPILNEEFSRSTDPDTNDILKDIDDLLND